MLYWNNYCNIRTSKVKLFANFCKKSHSKPAIFVHSPFCPHAFFFKHNLILYFTFICRFILFQNIPRSSNYNLLEYHRFHSTGSSLSFLSIVLFLHYFALSIYPREHQSNPGTLVLQFVLLWLYKIRPEVVAQNIKKAKNWFIARKKSKINTTEVSVYKLNHANGQTWNVQRDIM